MTLQRRTFLLTGAAALAAPALSRAAAPVTQLEGKAFGTSWRVTLPAGRKGLPERIGTLLAAIDAQMSPYRADSDLSRFNHAGAGGHAVAAQTAQVTQAALEIARASGGHFDPTVGPLVARWGFGPITGAPDRWQSLSVEGDALRKTHAQATLDLCGIAKGYALDQIVALMLDAGESAFLVDLGGELAARGRHPSGRIWTVGVEAPHGLAAKLRLDGRAIATSGDLAQGYDLGGRRYGHIIAPETAEPVASAVASVTVLAADAMTADGWATALFAAGREGPALARAQGLAALFQTRGGGHEATGDFARWLV